MVPERLNVNTGAVCRAWKFNPVSLAISRQNTGATAN